MSYRAAVETAGVFAAIVFDRKPLPGQKPDVTVALSCMYCHFAGIKSARDEIVGVENFGGEAAPAGDNPAAHPQRQQRGRDDHPRDRRVTARRVAGEEQARDVGRRIGVSLGSRPCRPAR